MSIRSLLPPKMRQAHVAKTLGVSRAVVNRWVNGNLDVPTRHLPALADLLGVSMDVLVSHAATNPTERRVS